MVWKNAILRFGISVAICALTAASFGSPAEAKHVRKSPVALANTNVRGEPDSPDQLLYKREILFDLGQREAVLAGQLKQLAADEKKLKQLQALMIDSSSKAAAEAATAAAAANGSDASNAADATAADTPEVSPSQKATFDYENMTNTVQIDRYEVIASENAIQQYQYIFSRL